VVVVVLLPAALPQPRRGPATGTAGAVARWRRVKALVVVALVVAPAGRMLLVVERRAGKEKRMVVPLSTK
jgi:hypothetical protein